MCKRFTPLLSVLLGFLLLLSGCQKRDARETGKPSDDPQDSTPEGNESSDISAAMDVLADYYEAINTKDYPRAYLLWASKGEASRQTLAEFSAGFSQTRMVELTTGESGRVGPRRTVVDVVAEAAPAPATPDTRAGQPATPKPHAPGDSIPSTFSTSAFRR